MISFYNNNIKFVFSNKLLIKKWIKEVAKSNDYKIGDINIIFMNDNDLLDINNKFLNHNYFTDIITFDYTEGNTLNGELYISIDTVKANAVEYGQVFLTELHRVIIHGILHLIGFDDHNEEDKLLMRKNEDASLELLLNLK